MITNDALAEAVATSDIATKMLDHLSVADMVGLTMWPEDLRHPFSIVADKPLLSLQDFAGMNIRTPRSALAYQIISALGGTPMFADSGYEIAESGLQQGGTLTGSPIATGNVTFYPKYEVLFANGAAFARLNDQQRTILRQAAAATQKKALANRPKEVDAAAAYCADGGSIVLASDEQVKALEQAVQPVFAKLEQEPLSAQFIQAIRDLKAKVTPAPGASACGSQAAQQNPAPAANNQVWSKDLPPNGAWRVELTTEDLVGMGLLKSAAIEWSGVYTWTFQDGQAENDVQGPTAKVYCKATAKVVGDAVRLHLLMGSNGCDGNAYDDVQWRLDADGLHFHHVGSNLGQSLELKAMYETKPWKKVEVWSPGLPPNGVWQVTQTVDDLVKMGLLRSLAQSDFAGVTTLTFKDGQSLEVWQGAQGKTGKCQANYEVVGDVVRFTYFGSPDECPNRVDEMQWRLDDQGLPHLHLVSTKNAPFIEIRAYLEAKPWQQVETWSPGLPPNGVWQYTLTVDELVQAGMLRSATPDWAGLYTFTFQDGKFMLVWLGEQGQKGECGGTYAVVDNFVRMTRTPITADCPREVDDIQWRLDKDGLHVHLLATPYGQLLEGQMMFDTKPWQKVK